MHCRKFNIFFQCRRRRRSELWVILFRAQNEMLIACEAATATPQRQLARAKSSDAIKVMTIFWEQDNMCYTAQRGSLFHCHVLHNKLTANLISVCHIRGQVCVGAGVCVWEGVCWPRPIFNYLSGSAYCQHLSLHFCLLNVNKNKHY